MNSQQSDILQREEFQQFELTQAVDAVLPLANSYTPEGSEPKAVARQWLYALAFGRDLYAESKGKPDLISNLIYVDRMQVETVLKQQFSNYSTELLKTAIELETNIQPSTENKFAFIDLFAGIGGMRIGFERAGGTCVFSSEFDVKAQNTYEKNTGKLHSVTSHRFHPI